MDPEQISTNEVLVNLEWTLLNSQIYQQFLRDIIVNTVPPLRDMIQFTGSTRAQLVLSYNTLYNVSVTQNSTCEQLIRTSFHQLSYSKLCMHIVCENNRIIYLAGKCSNPMEMTNALAMGYVDPALEGQTVIFSCAPGWMLNGSNQSTCMGNGRWEPDPRNVECIGK